MRTANKKLVSILNRLVENSIKSDVISNVSIRKDKETDIVTDVTFFDKERNNVTVSFYGFYTVEKNETLLKKCIEVLNGNEIQNIKTVEELFNEE